MNELKTKPIWVTWKYKADGGKLPISIITEHETGTNSVYSHGWGAFNELGDAERIGFTIPEGYFFLDINHRDTQSELVQELLNHFLTYAETSPSDNGIHIYGKCDSSRLPVKVSNGRSKLSSHYYIRNA